MHLETKHFNTNNLSLAQRKDICIRAHKKCFNWWADVLDCSKSYLRQKTDMTFDEIISKLNEKSYFHIIYRHIDGCLEVGFSTFEDPTYFLWIQLDAKYIEEFTIDL